MRLEVRVFGGLAERVGGARLSLELPDDATVGSLRSAVAAGYPSVAPLLASASVAVDLEVRPDEHPLAGAREVALLPPVAGGAGGARTVRTVTGLRPPPLDVEGTLAAITGPEVGGTAVFLGTVRDHAPGMERVTRLDYSAYPEMAERTLATIAEEIAREHPAVTGIALLHAVGDLEVGAHTVLVACAAAHRGPAFDACRDALERVKDRTPVWKREAAADGGHRWVGLAPSEAPTDEQPIAGVRPGSSHPGGSP